MRDNGLWKGTVESQGGMMKGRKVERATKIELHQRYRWNNDKACHYRRQASIPQIFDYKTRTLGFPSLSLSLPLTDCDEYNWGCIVQSSGAQLLRSSPIIPVDISRARSWQLITLRKQPITRPETMQMDKGLRSSEWPLHDTLIVTTWMMAGPLGEFRED